MQITHIFFDLHGVLVNSARLRDCFALGIGRLMAARYGGQSADWAAAHRKIQADWDSYYADLHLGGDEGLSDLYEGLYRTTRALFRLMNAPEPSQSELSKLSIMLAENAPDGCTEAFYSDVSSSVEKLHRAGYQLGICSYALSNQARTLFKSADLLDYFSGPIMGPDVAERFEKDERFYETAAHLANTSAQQCLVVDDSAHALHNAHAIGMVSAYMHRDAAPKAPQADITCASLQDLVDYLMP
jgi:FMN phosphatase YigB (HAD superfamily)